MIVSMASGWGPYVRTSFRAVALLSCLLGMPTVASAQAGPGVDPLLESWRWVRFGVDSGLQVDGVSRVIEADDGSIWAVTDAGVAWFDGFRWHPMGPSEGLPSVITGVTPGNDGRILVAAGARLYHGDAAGFSPVPLLVGEDTIRVGDVWKRSPDEIVVAGSNRMFRLTGAAALEPVDPPYEPDPQRGPMELVSGTIGPLSGMTLTVTSTEPRAYRMVDGAWVEIGPFHMDHVVGDLEAGYTLSATNEPNIGVWTWRPGEEPRRIDTGDPGLASSLAQNEAGDVVLTYASGAVHVRRGGVWTRLEGAPDPLRWARSLFFESNGDLWVPTASGLFLHRASSGLWTSIPPAPALGSARVGELLETRSGDLWIGTQTGLFVVRRTGAVDTLVVAPGEPIANVTALGEDTNGHVWVGRGSGDGGALRWDGTAWRRFAARDGLSDLNIHRISPDRRGRLWFLTLGPSRGPVEGDPAGGAYAWDGTSFERWSHADGLPSERVYSFAEAGDGTLWFGTVRGLARWKDGGWSHWGEAEGMASDRIFTLTVADDGVVWFSHRSEGLPVGQVGSDDRVSYVEAEGAALGLVNPWELETGPDGSVWATAANGLWRWKDGTVTHLGPASGLPATEHWPILPQRDRILVGTLGAGVRSLDLTAESQPTPVADIALAVDRGTAALRWQTLAYRGEQPPHQVLTRTRVDGVVWSPWSVGRDTTLVGLGPGEHIFEVQARGLLGQIGQPAVALFEIPRPFARRPAVVMTFLLWLGLMAYIGTEYFRRSRASRAHLQRQEARFRSLIDNAMDVVGVLDPDGWILFASASAADLLRVPRGELVGRHALEWTAPKVRALGVRTLRRALASEDPIGPVAVSLNRPDGEDAVVEAVLRRIPGEGSQPRILVNARDATERLRSKAERESLIGELEAKNEELEWFASTVSHDLKSPLVTIQGFLGLLTRDSAAGDHDGVQKDVEQISAATDSMQRMLSELLELSRVGRIANPSERVDLDELVAGVLARLGGPLAEAGAAVEVAGPLPAVTGDRVRLEEVFQNLVENAIKFMGPQSDPWIRIGVTSNPGGDIYFVQDNGVGLEARYQDRIFGLFNQLDPHRPGSGLGLALVRRIVRVHGGTIWVESAGQGHGSTFFFTLGWEPNRPRFPGSMRDLEPSLKAGLRG